MFPERPRRPMPLFPPARNQQPMQGRPNSSKSNLLSLLRNPEGKLDFDKISATAQQMNKLYGQVSPIITKFIKR